MPRLDEAIKQCIYKVSGPSVGTGYAISPRLVVTAAHVIKGRKSVGLRSPAGRAIEAAITQVDLVNDLAILELSSNSEQSTWMTLGDALNFGEACLVIGYPSGRLEYMECWVEGFRGDASNELKLRNGQFQPGFSGAPVVSRRSGEVLGTTSKTRDRDSALGGIAVLSSVLLTFHSDIVDTQSREIQDKWLDVAEQDRRDEQRQVEALPQPVWLTPVPVRDEGFFGRGAELERLAALGPQLLCQISGRRFSGKTELITEHLVRLQRGLTRTRNARQPALAFLDMNKYICDENVFLRAAAAQMNLSAPQSSIFPLLPEERLALISNSLAALVDGRSLWLAIDDGFSFLEQDVGARSFAVLLDVLPSKSMRLLLSAPSRLAEGGPIQQSVLGEASSVLLDGLGPEALTSLVEFELACTHSEAAAIASLIGRERNVIGPLRDALRSTARAADRAIDRQVVNAVISAIDRAAIDAVTKYCQAPDTLRDLTLFVVTSALRALCGWSFSSAGSGISSQIRELLDGTGMWEPAIKRYAGDLLEVLAAADSPVADLVDQAAIVLVESNELALLSRESVEHLLSVLSDGPSERRSSVRAILLDKLTLMTAVEPLGPVYPATIEDSVRAPITSFVLASRTARSPNTFLSRALSVADVLGSELHDPATINVIRQALIEIESRFDYHESINAARQAFIARVVKALDPLERLCQVHLVLDQARSCHIVGDYSQSAQLRVLASEWLWDPDFEWPANSELEQDYQLALVRQVITDLQAGEGTLLRIRNCIETLKKLIQLPRCQMDAGLLASDVLAGFTALRLDAETARSYVSEISELVGSSDSPASIRVRVLSKLAASIRDIAIRLFRGIERAELLREPVRLLAQNLDAMRERCRFYDNRPIATYCRCLLSLAHAIASSGGNPVEVQRLHRDAISQLKWVCETFPSSATWFVYLQALDYDLPEALEWDESAEQLTPFEQQSVKEGLADYKRWRRKRRGRVTARDWKVEAWAMERQWRLEGSLIAVCAASDIERWNRTPNATKHELVLHQYRTRRSAINRQIRAAGRSPEMSILEVKNEGQYQRLRSLYLRTEVDHRAVFDIFVAAEKELGRLPALELSKGSYYHYIWQFATAADVYAQIRTRTRDRVVDREARIGQAGALVNIVAYEEPGSGLRADALLGEAVELVWNLRHLDTRAQMLCLRADVERGQAAGLPTLEALVLRLRKHRNYASIFADEERFLFELSETMIHGDSGSDEAWATLAERFTDPRILLEFGSLLVRLHEVAAPSSVQYLEAALSCLEGARIMSRGTMAGARRPFNVAKALLLGCEQLESLNPFGWMTTRPEDAAYSDLVRARRLFQIAHDNSVGKFRFVARSYLNRARILYEDLALQDNGA